MKNKFLLIPVLLFVLFVGFQSCDENNDFVIFSPENDVQLGKQVNDEILSKPTEYPVLPRDKYPQAYTYLDNILDRILNSDEIKYKDMFAYKDIKIIHDDNVLNAFATPGGYIYVYTGLIKYLDSEDHLAGVLGHEIAHASLRHSSKALQRQMGIQLLLDIALGQNQGAVSQVLTQLGSLKFSRSAETEADEASVLYLSNPSSPYECTGAAGFFIKLTSQSDGQAVPEFLSTHPNPDNRVENIQTKASSVGCDTTPFNPATYQEFKNSLPQ